MSTLALYPRSLGNRVNRVEGSATKEQEQGAAPRTEERVGSAGVSIPTTKPLVSLIVIINFDGKTVLIN